LNVLVSEEEIPIMTDNNLNTTQNERQTNREKSIQKIVQYLGFSGIGVGLSATIKLLIEGKLREAIAVGLISIIITFMAITNGFVARLTNKILNKVNLKSKIDLTGW
jgi:hypothetical protein